MKISFLGACQEVTGSCILVETENLKFLVDCGMFQGQGSYEKNLKPFSFRSEELDFVLLTHAHLDHSGRLPILFKNGFRGKIFSTRATKELTEIILKDSALIFEKELRKPLFNLTDVLKTIDSFETFSYSEEVKIKDLVFIPRNSGHILGSTFFEVYLEGKKIVFGGDLGNENAPIIKDTTSISSADVLILESTYGGKIHEEREKGVLELKKNIEEVIQKKSVLLIPSFSIERTQEILFEINKLVETKEISSVNVFLDSPLAVKATAIYQKYEKLFDQESLTLINSGDDIFDFEGFEKTESFRDTQKFLAASNPKIIIAGSGMCSGGKMPLYLKIYGKDKRNIILLNSYQAEGTIGRSLETGKDIFINDKKIEIKAQVKKILSFSSHADSLKLKAWAMQMNPKKVFINHGEKEESLALKKSLEGVKEVILPTIEEKYII